MWYLLKRGIYKKNCGIFEATKNHHLKALNVGVLIFMLLLIFLESLYKLYICEDLNLLSEHKNREQY